MNRIRLAIIFFALMLMLAGANSRAPVGRAGIAPEIPKESLFKFRNNRNRWIFKRGNTIPSALSGGPWVNEGAVCYVASEAAPGLHPVYMFVDVNGVGAFYSYSQHAKAGDLFAGPGNAQNIGIEFYAATTQIPGTEPLYGFAKQAVWAADGSKVISGTGTYFMSLDKQVPDADWDKRGILGYVWTGKSLEDELRPDLTIVKTTVREAGIEAIIRNQGKKAVSSKPGVTAVLTVVDRDGKPVHFSGAKQLGGMSPNMQIPVLFETGNVDLPRKRYRVQVDAGTLVEESNENNNDTGFIEIPGPKIKINPLPADYVQPPSITLSEVKGLGAGRMNYNFSVTNWDKFRPEWFQSLENILPPGPCGSGNTDSRLIARTIVIHNSAPMPVACKPLNTQQDLRSIALTTPSRLGDSDRVRIYVEDRATGAKYESSPYPVGVFGVDKILVPMNCKFFLGRASSYMCSSDQGFAACENLRKQGKPIECRKTGSAQP